MDILIPPCVITPYDNGSTCDYDSAGGCVSFDPCPSYCFVLIEVCSTHVSICGNYIGVCGIVA